MICASFVIVYRVAKMPKELRFLFFVNFSMWIFERNNSIFVVWARELLPFTYPFGR